MEKDNVRKQLIEKCSLLSKEELVERYVDKMFPEIDKIVKDDGKKAALDDEVIDIIKKQIIAKANTKDFITKLMLTKNSYNNCLEPTKLMVDAAKQAIDDEVIKEMGKGIGEYLKEHYKEICEKILFRSIVDSIARSNILSETISDAINDSRY